MTFVMIIKHIITGMFKTEYTFGSNSTKLIPVKLILRRYKSIIVINPQTTAVLL